MKNIWYIAFGLICGFLFSGLILLLSSNPRGEEIILEPAPTPEPILVYITGAVSTPGIYPVERGSRLINVLDLAGGALPEADLESINLAEEVFDGEKIHIPEINTTQGETEINSTETPFPININTATQQDLELLPGIGPEKAAAIIAYRSTNGFFISKEQIMQVPGIGNEIYSEIEHLITIQ